MEWKKLILVLAIGIALASAPAWAEEGKADDNMLDIEAMTCKQLMSGDDLDREVGLGFFHGYFDGKKGVKVVDLPKASAVSTFVRDYCLSNPASTLMEAFVKAGK